MSHWQRKQIMITDLGYQMHKCIHTSSIRHMNTFSTCTQPYHVKILKTFIVSVWPVTMKFVSLLLPLYLYSSWRRERECICDRERETQTDRDRKNKRESWPDLVRLNAKRFKKSKYLINICLPYTQTYPFIRLIYCNIIPTFSFTRSSSDLHIAWVGVNNLGFTEEQKNIEQGSIKLKKLHVCIMPVQKKMAAWRSEVP